ncbi:MAG: hypothetical protein IIC92_06155 [Chloroflexi bacterium]|nr:hypothetical protein [Chloroflexota bacterium]
MRRIPGVLVIALVVLAASLVGARAVDAQEPGAPQGPREAIFGTVVEIGEGSITVATDDAISVLVIDDNTTLRINGDIVDLDAIAIGDALAGTVLVLDDGSLAARLILIRPADAARSFIHIVGVVTSVENGEVTLIDRDGATVTVALPPGEAAPEIGDALTTVAKRDRVTDRLAAHALEKVEAIVDRLEKALERAEEAFRNSANDTAQAKLDDLKQRIKLNTSRHLGLVDQVKATALSGAADALDRKFAAVQRHYEDVADRTGIARPVVEARGVVREVSAGAIVIVLPNGAEIRISLDRDAVTENIEGDVTDVSEFVIGTDVIVEYLPTSGGNRSASFVRERKPELSRQEEARINLESEREFAGMITSVQRPSEGELTDAIAIVIIANPGTGQKVVVRVTRATEIKVNEQESGIDGLSPGQFVEVELLSELVASEIKAYDVRPDARDEELRIGGVVRRIDHVMGVLEIVTRDTDGGLVELRVNGSTVIVMDGEEVTLFDVGPGDLVLDATRFRARDHVLIRLVLRSQKEFRISGVFAGVNQLESVFTVITGGGDTVTFNALPDTRVDGPHGENLRLADIAPGFRLIEGRIRTVTFNGINQHVATRLVVSAPELVTARGEVLRVGATAGNLVILLTNGREVLLSLPANGRFTIIKDGERLDGLRGIERGDLVHSVAYQPLGNTIVKLEILTPGGTAVRGIIVGVDPGSNRIKIEMATGKELELIATDASELRLDGERIRSLSRLEEGDVVVNALYVARIAGNVILRLDAISGRPATEIRGRPDVVDRPDVEIRVKGIIRAINGDTWLVAETRFIVNAETEFEGDTPVQGAVASVLLVRGDHDLPLAVEVEVEAPDRRDAARTAPAGAPTPGISRITLSGLIEEIDGGEWTVGGHKFTVNRQTEVIGEPEIGARAGVVVVKIASGELIALQISVERIKSRFPASSDSAPAHEPGDVDESDSSGSGSGSDDDSDSSGSGSGSDDDSDSSGSGSGSDDDSDSSGSGSGSDDDSDSSGSGSGGSSSSS